MKLRALAAGAAAIGLASSFAPQVAAGEVTARHYALHTHSAQGCVGLPFPPSERVLSVSGELAADATARFWRLDQPSAYQGGRSRALYRMGAGRIEVQSELSHDLTTETFHISITEPVQPDYLAVYLPGVALPCERVVTYTPEDRGEGAIDIEAIARFDRALHESAELLYDDRFAAAMALLREAIALRPDDPAPYWMMARALYLSMESRGAPAPRSASSAPPSSLAIAPSAASAALADGGPSGDESPGLIRGDDRLAVYAQAEAWADRAVERAPTQPEGYLWQAIARGRIATAQGSIRTALRGAVGGRGPRWLQETLERAVSLRETYRFFGDSTRADALYALAQFYRIAPDAWYMVAVGARGNIERSIALLREAVELQPTRIEYRKELAVALLCRAAPGDAEAAREQIDALVALPAITPIDAIDQAHARALRLDSPANICGYSRDGVLAEDE